MEGQRGMYKPRGVAGGREGWVGSKQPRICQERGVKRFSNLVVSAARILF